MVVNIYRAKLAVVGDQAVGKTALTQVFTSNGANYPKIYNMTFGAEVMTKIITIPSTDDAVELLIYDSPGFDAYTEYLDRFWNKPDLLMLVYDITNKKSIDSVPYWLKRCLDAEWRSSNGKPICIVLFGNKTDSSNKSDVTDVAEEFASQNNIQHFTGSAKENKGIEEAMKYLSEEYYNATEKKPTTNYQRIKSFVFKEIYNNSSKTYSSLKNMQVVENNNVFLNTTPNITYIQFKGKQIRKIIF